MAHGSALVASPVFGKPDVAAARQALGGCIGPRRGARKLKAAQAAIGQGTHDFGDRPRRGQRGQALRQFPARHRD
ncbi:MAG: hypothetical protein WKG07_47375 [Hymenobacter sp.]